MKRPLLLHLPLLGAVGLWGLLGAVDAGWLPALRTEQNFGWIVVVWMPLVAALVATQVGWWVTALGRRFGFWSDAGRRRGLWLALVPLALWGLGAGWIVWMELVK